MDVNDSFYFFLTIFSLLTSIFLQDVYVTVHSLLHRVDYIEWTLKSLRLITFQRNTGEGNDGK